MWTKIVMALLTGAMSYMLGYGTVMVYDTNEIAKGLVTPQENYILQANEAEWHPPVIEEPPLPEPEPEPVEQPAYEEPVYYEPVYSPQVYYGNGRYSDNSFKSDGVVYGEDGTRYTWYSQNVLPGGGLTELNANGRHVNDQGYICDGDGYVAVASSDHAIGTVLETPFGDAKVYDSGCASGTVDIYTDF